MEKIRMGIIGCGGMAGTHAHGLHDLSQLLQITADCDIVLERAQAAANSAGAGLAVTDYRDLLESVDAVLIALPHDLHFEVGMACLEAGKHVLMEKPLCNTEEECIRIIEKAEQEKLVLMTAYPVRFWPIVKKMKELVDTKAYGDVFQMSIWTEQFTYAAPDSWLASAEQLGGGQFFSHGCHYVDLLLWFLGQPVKGMHMGNRIGTPWLEKEGTSNVVMEFESGVLGYHFGTWGARGSRLGYSIHIHCTEGMLEYDIGKRTLYLHSQIKEENADMNTTSQIQVLMEEPEAGKMTQFEIKHFLECILNGETPLTDGPGSLQGLRVIWRMYEAEQTSSFADLRGLGLEDDWKSPLASS
ncbi:Gfo/Idh/MocA family protein [Paenibacillus eucommiae]|uniref:Dehydrogenase n=1 Tax=Paenibacillus eucommiae TaxID=1355755 RepID=A0ABS4IM09_9BACL|nr:Gfo/Idh/MocA family oxidoreductase [Paenibacillus eucommiae]MBP1988599.1 putative dehydrogenase [Paenibacillus eucommiae]